MSFRRCGVWRRDEMTTPGFETLAVHAGAAPDPATGARATPIYQTTSFVFDDVDHAAALFGLQKFGNIYTRITQPDAGRCWRSASPRSKAARRRCAVASGHAAQFLVFHTLMQPGDEFVAVAPALRRLDQPVHPLLQELRLARRAGPTPTISQTFEAAISRKTKAIFIESIANPGGIVADIAAIADDRATRPACR